MILFENDVKTYSIQTVVSAVCRSGLFENDVKTYSIQTKQKRKQKYIWFENDVKTYSIQTNRSSVMYILGQLLVYGLILFVIYLILSYGELV